MATSPALVALTLTALALLAAPAAVSAGSVGLYVGSNGVGLSVSSHGWGFYGSSWNDPGWSLDFDTALAGYGSWIWVDGLGRVWHPAVAADWRPYTYGRWIDTPGGWTWVAYEPWGYIPHHFGEWALTVYGWAWVPGYTYRPANVVWVHSGGNIGWYPCAPRGWSHWRRGYNRGHDRGYDRGYRNGHRDGYGHGYDNGYDDGYWRGWQDARYATFVRWNDMTSDDVSRHAMNADRVRGRGSVAPVERLSSPPSAAEVSRRTGRPVPRAELDQRTVTVGGREVSVARPRGVERSVEANAGMTVDRALAPEVSRRVREGRLVTQPGRVDSTPSGRTTAVAAPGQDRGRTTVGRVDRTGRTAGTSAAGSIDRSTRTGPVSSDRSASSSPAPRVTRQPATASRVPVSSTTGSRVRTGTSSSGPSSPRVSTRTTTRSVPPTGRTSTPVRTVGGSTRSASPTAVRRQSPIRGTAPRPTATDSRARTTRATATSATSRTDRSPSAGSSRSTAARSPRSATSREESARGGSQTRTRPEATSSSRSTRSGSGRRDRRR
jgi:hypothetical protein